MTKLTATERQHITVGIQANYAKTLAEFDDGIDWGDESSENSSNIADETPLHEYKPFKLPSITLSVAPPAPAKLDTPPLNDDYKDFYMDDAEELDHAEAAVRQRLNRYSTFTWHHAFKPTDYVSVSLCGPNTVVVVSDVDEALDKRPLRLCSNRYPSYTFVWSDGSA